MSEHTTKGNPKRHYLRPISGMRLCNMKRFIQVSQSKGKWRHRDTSAVLIEFLMWWLQETQDEGLTKVSVNAFPYRSRARDPIPYPHARTGVTSLLMGEGIADKFSELKDCFEFLSKKSGLGSRPSSSKLIEFLIWYFEATKIDEKLTKISIYDFEPMKKKGRSQALDNLYAETTRQKKRGVQPCDIRKLLGPRVDKTTADRKFR